MGFLTWGDTSYETGIYYTTSLEVMKPASEYIEQFQGKRAHVRIPPFWVGQKPAISRAYIGEIDAGMEYASNS